MLPTCRSHSTGQGVLGEAFDAGDGLRDHGRMNILIFLGGLVLLVIGANVLVRGASKLALSFGISPLVVGLTIVAFGTSAPEVAVSVGAVFDGKTDIAIGNVVGSNIFNVLFILGLSALIAPLVVNIQLIRQEVPIMIGASVLLLAMGLDGQLSFFDGGVLFVLLVSYTVFLVVQSRRESQAAKDEYAGEFKPAVAGAWDDRLPVQLLLIAVGLAALVFGSEYLVQASVSFAKAMGVSDLVIALTIVSAGTSMPEVATSITAAIKGERDIAVGNVVGSNTFNILGCLGLSGLVSGDLGLVMAPSLLTFDIWVMLAVALACLPVFMTGREIARWEGSVFLGYYAAYVAYLILAAQQHDALQAFSGVMLSFVVPLTVVTLVVVMIRRPAASRSS
ncbi:MAG: calcium/sodium antiporter [Hydrogenophaga sp.]|nr:calcium/sodium antiporter [Hydrogenophaga sp.]MDP3204032.1 calcium/sodium antiporter [Hydrogenophaga sp.]MDP3628849.1 calcium/sodium antiporter [Hydrogenophaga sp.]